VALKFAAELSRQPHPCPNPAKFAPRACVAYRFLRKPSDEGDFEPKLDDVRGHVTCAHYALSFFSSIEKAQERYSSLAAANDDDGQTAIKRYGDHIGEVALSATDGLMDEPNPRTGHIGLHQAVGATFSGRVSRYFTCEFLERYPILHYTIVAADDLVHP